MFWLVLVIAVLVAFCAGYYVCIRTVPSSLAKMSDDELIRLARKVRVRRDS